MGAVLKATDKLLNKEVAIKTINPNFISYEADDDADFKHRLFFREAMTHARIGQIHPEKILRVNNYGIEDETPFMELDLVQGGSLADRITEAKRSKRRGALFEESIIRDICNQICDGLKLLHEQGVYHSDLKPPNILFDQKTSWNLRIADLGIARIAQSGFLTRVGMQTFGGGTMPYTPQAIVEGSSKANSETDLYSVGVILFELLLGEPLKWSQAEKEFVQQHAGLTEAAKELIMKACHLMGRNNFKSAEQFKELLATCGKLI